MQDLIDLEHEFGSHIYNSIPVVFTKASGCYLYDCEGRRYTDLMSAYSAASLGHSNPKILKTLVEQACRLGVVSRAVHNDQLPEFLKQVCHLSKLDKAIPMNSGAEAVETALKVARKWGAQIKGVEGEIIVAQNNFHGRTLGIISFSSDAHYKKDFAPFLPGFKEVPFNNAQALEAAITDKTIAFLVEPIQGEAGIIIPDSDYLAQVREICTRHNVLMILDEIQCGLARTGTLFCHAEVRPDILILGKALGGGIYPVSCVVGTQEVMSTMTAGTHGSTFGGNAIASAIAICALEELSKPELLSHVEALGRKSLQYLRDHLTGRVTDIRGKGLFIGIELRVDAKPFIKELLAQGIVTKETHERTIRIAPPLNISESEMMQALETVVDVLKT